MEQQPQLRQRSQRPSEPSNQSASAAAPWSHQRQASESHIQHRANAAPPPPPRRSPGVPAAGSSPMFHNPHSYSQLGTATRQSATPAGYSYPRHASYTAPAAASSSYTAGYSSYGRSHTEPLYQQEAVASSSANVPPSPNYSYSPAAARTSYHNLSSSARSSGSLYDDQSASAGCYNYNTASSIPAHPSADKGYGGYNVSTSSFGSNLSNATATPPSSTNAPNPYKMANSKKSKCSRFLSSLLYLSILTLAASSVYLRHKVKLAHEQLETAHQHAHRRHLSHVKRTGGRHTTNNNSNNNQNQLNEIAKLENSNKDTQSQIDEKAQHQEQLQQKYQTIKGKYNGLEATKSNILKSIEHESALLDVMKDQKEEVEAMLLGMNQLEEVVKKREEALWKRVDRLTGKIGEESFREAVDWFQKDYGAGPYKVEIELSFPQVPPEDHPNPQSWQRVSQWIVVELAPLDIMPHSVNMFLRQVHHKMWEGMTMVLKDEKKIQFGPRTTHGEERNFGRNFSKLLYQEYSNKYTHEQWTLGYAGRPGGPDFYINLVDNTEEFGPGMDRHSEADPCFGRVVEGFDVLERIGMIPKYLGGEEEELAGFYEVKMLQALIIKPRELRDEQQPEAMEH